MAVKFPFVSAFLCENVLREEGGILSAIRIVDVFQIPEGTPAEAALIHFWAIVSLRTVPVPDEEVRFGVTLVRVTGERQRLSVGTEQPTKLAVFENDPSVPGGVNLILQVNIKAKNTGTAYIEVDVDGEVVTRIPFTIRRIPAAPAL